jgi:diguanylate cyclase (GGDEF)-like protein/PAS domain S-box-containing protein
MEHHNKELYNLINVFENEAIILNNNLEIVYMNQKFFNNNDLNIEDISKFKTIEFLMIDNYGIFENFFNDKNINEITITINNKNRKFKKIYFDNYVIIVLSNEIIEDISDDKLFGNKVLTEKSMLLKLNDLVSSSKNELKEKLENEYDKQHTFFKYLINSIPVPIFYMDKNGVYTGFNKAYQDFFGEDEKKIIGKNVFDLNTKEIANEYYLRDKELLENNIEQIYETNITDFQGINHHVIFHKSSIINKNNEITGLIGVITNISKQKEIEHQLRDKSEELEKISLLDGLTQISNRRCFDLQLEKLYKDSLRHSYNLAVMMIDVDHFKLYNDNYGHAEGDKTLIRVAKALKNTIKRPNDFVARYGGEEFSIILEDIHEEGVKIIAEELLKSIKNLKIKHEFSDTNEIITISIGISILDNRVISKEELLKESDEALYYAKRKGRNQYYIKKNNEEN